MKVFIRVFVVGLVLFFGAVSFGRSVPVYPIELLPDAPSSSYHVDVIADLSPRFFGADFISLAVQAGKRNLDWLKFMNSTRPASDQIVWTKPGDLQGIPIDHPIFYSPKTVEAVYQDLLATIPPDMQQIIFSGAAMMAVPTTAMDQYILWAKKVDKMYQTASRWLLVSPHLDWYTQNKQSDIRGYYYLAQELNVEQELKTWGQLSAVDQARLNPYLVNICENAGTETSTCQVFLQTAIGQNAVLDFYNKYFSDAKDLYDGYFQLVGTRPDVVWTSQNPNLTTIPFLNTTPAVEDYLKINIEDEWKWNGWQLQLNFTSTADVHVVFQPGATPHVNEINGNTITMDDNAPLTEWDVQWTIRHEFGHVLGFPDCYVEFYDATVEQMVSYQLDITNLMCSRSGKFKQVHFDELKKNYLH